MIGLMILVFGSICVDRVRRVPHMPKMGGYVEILSESFMLGGEAANTANALHMWGADIVLAGNSFGTGFAGRIVREQLVSHGLKPDERHLVRDLEAPMCDVYVSEGGERTMIGQGFSVSGESVDPALLPYQAGEWFTAEPNMQEASRQAIKLAHEAGMKTYTMDFCERDEPIYPGSFWQSSTDWAGTRNNIQRNAEFVRKHVCKYESFSILSDGPNGFVAGSPELPPRAYPPYPAEEVVDVTGAGDLFRAGMLFGLNQAWPISQCLQFASAAGALQCRSLGATSNVPSRAEIEALIAAHPQVSSHYL